jgi:hypothetical protein
MDSSESPTSGEQEGSSYNGHFGWTCYHPILVFNQLGDLERCALRLGNAHSAAGWRGVLRLARSAGASDRPLSGYGDAVVFHRRRGLSQPGVAGKGRTLKRPVGRSSHEVGRYYGSFGYQAVAVPRQMFQEILSLIAQLRAPPALA